MKQQEQAILEVINGFNLWFSLKVALFSHFSDGSGIKTNFIQFLIFGKSRFPPKSFITSTTGRETVSFEKGRQ